MFSWHCLGFSCCFCEQFSIWSWTCWNTKILFYFFTIISSLQFGDLLLNPQFDLNLISRLTHPIQAYSSLLQLPWSFNYQSCLSVHCLQQPASPVNYLLNWSRPALSPQVHWAKQSNTIQRCSRPSWRSSWDNFKALIFTYGLSMVAIIGHFWVIFKGPCIILGLYLVEGWWSKTFWF